MNTSDTLRKIPVILDTDIGYDIDDTWALAMLLNSPELDVKLVVTACGNTTYQAKIVARMLEAAGRTDIPIGVGIHTSDTMGGQEPWVQGYELGTYPGMVHANGVVALVDTIMGSTEPVTLISIGPLTNVAVALEREPRIAGRARFVGMHGSIRVGYGGSPEIAAEYNVKVDPPACRRVFAAPWPVTITPLDTCGNVRLTGEKYLRVRDCGTPLARALIENYRVWDGHFKSEAYVTASSVLFDTVAVYLAFAEDLVEMEELGVSVTDDGRTLVDPSARPIRCATAWKDLDKFEDLLVQRLIV